MTYIEQIAKMLDVEINEEFKIEGHDDNLKFKFTENRFLQSYGDVYGWVDSISIMTVLEGRAKIIKLPKPKHVLDDVEKEYLSYLIKPFRQRIKYFYKYSCGNGEYEAIAAIMETYGYFDYLTFPKFKKGSMYKGMGLMREYTLNDLGL